MLPPHDPSRKPVIWLDGIVRPKLLLVYEDTAPVVEVAARAVVVPDLSKTHMDMVEEVFCDFFNDALQRKLACLGFRRIGEIDEAELETLLPGCLRYLIGKLMIACRRLYPQFADQQGRTREPSRSARDSHAPGGTSDESLGRIGPAFLQLHEHLLTVLVLRYYAGLEPKEIARRLRISLSTVEDWLGDAKKELANTLACLH